MPILEKIKNALDIPFIPEIPFVEYNEVPKGMGCPKCGEADIDNLLIDDETDWPDATVKCETCGHKYIL